MHLSHVASITLLASLVVSAGAFAVKPRILSENQHINCRLQRLARAREYRDISEQGNSRCFLSRLKLDMKFETTNNSMDSVLTRNGHVGRANLRRRLLLSQIIQVSLVPLAYAASLPKMEVYGQPEMSQGLGPLDPLLSIFGGGNANRPPPVKLPRIGLFKQFAVLLMRSSYEVADDLDFVPMDRFQKEFFLLRADEWEKYREETDARQGDLSNALYFDFISAAQYATITKLMKEGQTMFEERIGAEGTVQVVQRNPAVSNDMLRPAFFEKVGDRILDTLYTNFTGPDFYTQPPQPCSTNAPVECVVKGLSQLYQVFYENGYSKEITLTDAGDLPGQQYIQELSRLQAWAGTFRPPAGGGGGGGEGRKALTRGAGRRIVVNLQVPCTLWGRRWLQSRGDLLNDHDLMAAAAFVRRCGREVTIRSTVDGNSYAREINIL